MYLVCLLFVFEETQACRLCDVAQFASPERYRFVHNLWFAILTLVIVNLFFSILQSEEHARVMAAETAEEFVSQLEHSPHLYFSKKTG